MINRNFTRTILNTTETTAKTKSLSASTLAFTLTTTGYFYLGFKQPFSTRYFHLSVPNTNACTLSIEFWNGTEWKSVEDLIDETNGFTQSGFISWLNFSTWTLSNQAPITAVNTANSTQPDLRYYWIRIRPSANLSGPTELQSVVNLFCHDTLFRTYYPDLLTDTRYLPANRTDFMEQYVAAKDHVVRRMRQMSKITDEGDILDITDVGVAACHATAYVILNPIARDEESRAAADAAYKECEKELSRGTQSIDENKDGQLDASEKFSGTTHLTR